MGSPGACGLLGRELETVIAAAHAPDADRGTIAFGERLLTLLDLGSFTATYKYAVLLALIDLCLEQSDGAGGAPTVLTTRQLAHKTVELYWGHTIPFISPAGEHILRQSTGGQAQILGLIARFREREVGDPFTTLAEARSRDPRAFQRLVEAVEWKLIEMPLPRLQMVGTRHEPFVYQIGWEVGVIRRAAGGPDFDNRIHLLHGAGDHLVRLAGLLRPLVQREWASMVARLNREMVEESRLEEFLFGTPRIRLDRVRAPLRDLQEGRCFYCEQLMSGPVEVDHFVPWTRYPDNGLDNLVLSDRRCNNAKRNFLPAVEHVERWRARSIPGSPSAEIIRRVEQDTGWERHPGRTLSVARAIYLRLPAHAKLWVAPDEFADADRAALASALA